MIIVGILHHITHTKCLLCHIRDSTLVIMDIMLRTWRDVPVLPHTIQDMECLSPAYNRWATMELHHYTLRQVTLII